MNNITTHLVFDPVIPPWVIVALTIVALALFFLQLRRARIKTFYRLLFSLLLIATLLQPKIAHDVRAPLKDVVLLATDKSASMDMGKRKATADATATLLKDKITKLKNIELRQIDVASGADDETRVFEAIDAALRDVSAARRAGVILLTDGQVTDKPSPDLLNTTPVNVILTGSKSDKDREIKIINATAYSLLGQKVRVKFRINDHNIDAGYAARIGITYPDGTKQEKNFPVNADQEIDLPVIQPGQNIFELSAPLTAGELSALNNHAIISVQGVRNRLKVLLVSGEPYPGARLFRDLLKADPGVDLVHFTILRSPEKIDMTPPQELSLIAFPFQELFETKLKQFDLIIMDRFGLNTVLPDYYFQNIRNYVQGGGALLDIIGPSYATPNSIYRTSLGSILPGEPAGTLVRASVKPILTTLGKTHPVTQPFANAQNWGHWLEQQPVQVSSGDVLMTGIDNDPLLILERVRAGRVAQLTSGQIWLWSRGYDGGGPTVDLMRRTIHWLMKEPELDENAVFVNVEDNVIKIRAHQSKENKATITGPTGTAASVQLAKGEDGWLSGQSSSLSRGIYGIELDGTRKIASIGNLTTHEFTNIFTTKDILAPFISASNGTLIWAEDKNNDVAVREVSPRANAPSDAIAIRRHGASSLISSESRALLPEWAMMLLVSLTALLLWWRESRPARP